MSLRRPTLKYPDGLPDQCYALLPSTGQLIRLVKGLAGYYPATEIVLKGATPAEAARTLNEAKGITQRQVAAMIAGSLFGWDVPAADPDNPVHLGANPYANLLEGREQ